MIQPWISIFKLKVNFLPVTIQSLIKLYFEADAENQTLPLFDELFNMYCTHLTI